MLTAAARCCQMVICIYCTGYIWLLVQTTYSHKVVYKVVFYSLGEKYLWKPDFSKYLSCLQKPGVLFILKLRNQLTREVDYNMVTYSKCMLMHCMSHFPSGLK